MDQRDEQSHGPPRPPPEHAQSGHGTGPPKSVAEGNQPGQLHRGRDQAKRAIVPGFGRRRRRRRQCFGAQRASWGGVHRPSGRSWTIVDLDLGIGAFYLSETVATLLDLNYHIRIVLAWPAQTSDVGVGRMEAQRQTWQTPDEVGLASPSRPPGRGGRNSGVLAPTSPNSLGVNSAKFFFHTKARQPGSSSVALPSPSGQAGQGLSALPGSRTPFRAFLFFLSSFFVRLKNPSSRSTSSPPRLSRPTPGAAAPRTMASGSSGPRIGSAGSTEPQQQPRAILLPTITTQDSRRQRGQAKHGRLDCQVSGQPDRSSSRGGDPSASHPNPHDMDIGRR